VLRTGYHRRRERQERSKPIAEALAAWAEETVRKLSRKSELAAAFRYMRGRWPALVRHHDDYTGRYRDVNDLAAGAPLNILASNATLIECVPAIADLDLLPDMGRMTGRLRLAARTGCSPAPTPVDAAPPRCTR
jgi:Transposase IS66 family